MKSESIMDISMYFEQNTQINPMSVRGELAAIRFILCNFTLALSQRELNDCKGTLR